MIMVDYAHSADAFENLLTSIPNYYKNTVVLYRFGGYRDITKRPKIAKIVSKYATLISKNSSKLLLAIHKYFNLSSIGIFLSAACLTTRWLNSRRLNSLVKRLFSFITTSQINHQAF